MFLIFSFIDTIEYLYSILVNEEDGSILTMEEAGCAPIAKSKNEILKKQTELKKKSVNEVNTTVMKLPSLFPNEADKVNLYFSMLVMNTCCALLLF